ncbi:hypothetical protein [Halodesulfovibrio aestuarii]|uniref:hypothetical protein n=1 Tax=Halodesulfovibrio aestuarii TaxID=126333 RepID=UPI003D32C398
MVFLTLPTVLRITLLYLLLLVAVAQGACASDALQGECDISTGFVSSLQKQLTGDKARLVRLRNKIATLGLQSFAGALHSYKEFTIKLPLGDTIVPFVHTPCGLQFDGLKVTSKSAGVSFYDVDQGAAVVAVIPGSQDAVQWEHFLTTSVRSPEDVLFREPNGVIYYDSNENTLVAVYHQYKAITGVHLVGKSIVSGITCAERNSSVRTSDGYVEGLTKKCALDPDEKDGIVKGSNKTISPCRMNSQKITSVGSGLSTEPDMPPDSASMIASASSTSATVHSRCRRGQARAGGIKEILHAYSLLRTLNPQHCALSDTFIKAYSINSYGVKNAYIVWNNNGEGGVLLADGTVVVPPKYCSLYVDTFGYVVTDDNGVGVLDFSGNTILPCEYTLFTLNDDGLLKVGKQTSSSGIMLYGIYNLQTRMWVKPIGR